MFGGLFNQKKYVVQDGSWGTPQPPPPQQSYVQGQYPQQQQPVYPQQQQFQQPPQQPLPPQQPVNSGIGSTMQPEKREDMSALSHLDARATTVLTQAQQETIRLKQALIEPDQILLALLFDKEIFKLLEQFNLKVADISREIQSREKPGTYAGPTTLSQDSKKIFEDAYVSAKKRGTDFISPEDLLVAFTNANIEASKMLQTQGVSKGSLEEKLEKSGEFKSAKKSFLDKFGIDLTEQARKGILDPVSERDKEIDRMIHILLRRIKNNPIIIGEAGVGKTAIVEGLAQLIVQGKVPAELKNKRIIQIDVASLVAGASHRGEFEERLRSLIQEAQGSNGTVVLFIDEIHTLIGTGDTEGALDASNIIKPFLARGQLQIIGSTTTIEYRHYFEKDKAFERRFQTVLCEEPSEEAAVKMIEILKPKYEKFHNVVLTPESVAAAVKLSKRYIGERFLPDKAVDVIDEASAEVKLLNSSGKRADKNVNADDINKVIASWTGIPISKLTENESEKLLHLEDTIHKRFIDQEKAVKAVAEAVRRGRIGLANVMRPIASFIFLGPTGTGKTELAKTIAEILFGKEEAMIRLDMSEYMEKHEVAKLIGAPPGYVGYEEGGQLTEAVRIKPYSVVLLDEVEKAHPDVFNILLQLLEDGRLTDNKGNTISFKNTIIICTSNIGSSIIQQYLMDSGKKDAADTAATANQATPTPIPDNKPLDPNQKNEQEAQNALSEVDKKKADKEKKMKELYGIVSDELHKFFKPELLNRFDEIIIFEPLGAEVMQDITKLRLKATKKLLMEQNIDINVSDKALAQLAKDGYDPAYGARPLRRLVQSVIENPIASLILGRTFVAGDVIEVDYDDKAEKYVFNKGVKKVLDTATPTQPGQSQQPQSPATDGSAQSLPNGVGQPNTQQMSQAGSPIVGANQSYTQQYYQQTPQPDASMQPQAPTGPQYNPLTESIVNPLAPQPGQPMPSTGGAVGQNPIQDYTDLLSQFKK
ncbi:MAG TPA: ATP-dependent Clp protease ATP-binding subunit [Candidatus Saccharimonadales bacterium]|nr:ATP-dependent Clp protease ATP-binding subunit [Candidatus Saccharimonadales bacterium]